MNRLDWYDTYDGDDDEYDDNGDGDGNDVSM